MPSRRSPSSSVLGNSGRDRDIKGEAFSSQGDVLDEGIRDTGKTTEQDDGEVDDVVVVTRNRKERRDSVTDRIVKGECCFVETGSCREEREHVARENGRETPGQ